MAIPVVQGSDVIAAPYAASGLDAGRLMAPGDAMVGLGKSMGYAAQVIGEFGERKMKAVNAATAADAQVQMEKAFNEYQIEMSRMTDPDPYTNAEEKWAEGWQKKSEALKNKLLSDPKIAPVVKDHLQVALTNFIGQTSDRINTQANTRSIQRQKAKLTNAASFMYENGQIEKGDGMVEEMTRHGLIFPEEEFHIKKQGHEQADLSQVAKGLNTDPIATLDALEEQTEGGKWRQFKNLDEGTRLSLTRRARTEMEALRAETVRSFQDRINQGDVVKPDEMQSAVDARKMTPQQFKWLNAQITGKSNYAEDVVRMVGLTRRVDKWKPGNADSDAELHRIAADMAGLPKDMQNRLEADLHKVSSAPGSTKEKPTEGFGYIDDLLKGGFLGPTHGEVEDVKKGFFGDKKTKRKVTMEEAQASYGKALELRDALKTFVKEKPLATAAEQRDFINGHIQGQVDVTAATPVLNSLSGRAQMPQGSTQTPKVTTKAQRDALPSGTRYMGSDGQIYLKK